MKPYCNFKPTFCRFPSLARASRKRRRSARVIWRVWRSISGNRKTKLKKRGRSIKFTSRKCQPKKRKSCGRDGRKRSNARKVGSDNRHRQDTKNKKRRGTIARSPSLFLFIKSG